MENARQQQAWSGLWIPFALILITIGMSFWAYPALPERLDTFSDVDWMTQKTVVAAFIPLVMLFIFAMFRLASFVGRNYFDMQRIKRLFDWWLIFLLGFLLVIHAFMLELPSNGNLSLSDQDTVVKLVALMFAIYLMLVGNYFPRLQRSMLQKKSAPDQDKPWAVVVTVLKMKLLGLNFLGELYLLGLGSRKDDPRLQQQIGSFASRSLMLGGILVGLSVLLPGIYPIFGLIAVMAAIGATTFLFMTRLKKNR
ncbi:hypothetical protein PA598K_04261 [Paenibacillus sp. 598K]|uniref:hypothetical protein n=1 Tax=Paenibacillus sp. 598K TaxID=1117987 RepID=UPI000FF93D6A|nr:hypothetical protein [Paenibacillus sp. 598K]GBF75829.1 hypothetical protein PA598K_04261 [Paenibacillus sp. 598K]